MSSFKKYKILVISNYRGAHQCRPEAEIFIALQQLGHHITIMTYADADYIGNFQVVGIKVISYHPQKKWDRDGIQLIRKTIHDEEYDFLHLYNNKAITNGVIAAKKFPVKVIIYRGASANMEWYNPYNYFKFLHPRIDAVICNSEEIRERFLGMPFYNKEKAVTILKGHDPEWYEDVQSQNIREELNIDDGDILYVTVANNRKVKGIKSLLEAIEKLPNNANCAFLIVGDKMERFKTQKKWKNHPKVKFLGYLSDVMKIVKSCDVYLLPSIGSEALTKSVIEAMSMGVPALISDLEGNKPLIEHRKNGWIFSAGDSASMSKLIYEISRDKVSISRMGEAAKKKIASEIHINNTIAEYLQLYERLS